MGTVRRVTPSTLNRQLQADLKRVRSKTVEAVKRTADMGATVVRAKAPTAFGDIRSGIVVKPNRRGASILSTAPHSAPVEVGSRPHFPPIAPIEAWVKLRGAQGLDADDSGGAAVGDAGSVAAAIAGTGDGSSTPVGGPRQVAFMIARAISQRGTKPHWFMRGSLPEIRQLVHAYVTQALKNQGL